MRFLALVGGVCLVLMVLFFGLWGFAYVIACGMSDAPHTCSLPFLGYIN